jgi:methyl-accepting chemotaxis protein
MTVKQKLQALMLVTLVAILAGIIAAIVGFNSTDRAQSNEHRRSTQVRGLTEVKASLLATLQLDPTSSDTKEVFDDSGHNIEKWSNIIGTTFADPKYRDELGKIVAAWNNYDQQSRQIIALAAQDPKTANSRVTDLYHAQFLPLKTSLQNLIDEISSLEAQSNQEAQDAGTIAVRTVTAVLVVVLAVVLGWVVVLSRSIQRTLGGEPDHAASLCRHISQGDLTVAVQTDGAESLMTAMRDMQRQLVAIVQGIKHSAESIATGAHEIAAGNSNLSQRTEEQAASLEETAASMDQLAGTVRQNAENAKQAAELAESASGVARRGGDVVGEVVGTMRGISDSSSRVAEIIGVIEGIAFQTNILALNAAVEAARAGEQGRGFAVVASEVRSLAQRSAAAAKEIKALIDESVERVDAGSKLVVEAGSTIGEIVRSVTRVTDIVREISAASEEQRTGIDQVNRAVSQMDEVTQQNAALVEQAFAATQSMNEQAQALKDAVSVFRVA